MAGPSLSYAERDLRRICRMARMMALRRLGHSLREIGHVEHLSRSYVATMVERYARMERLHRYHIGWVERVRGAE